MKKIKVLHLSSERTWRGGEQQIAYLIGELNASEVENLVAVKKNSAFEAHCQKENIPCFSLSFRNSMDMATAWKIREICREHAVDLIHMHSSKSHGIAVLSALFGNRAPLILSRRVDFVPRKTWFTKWKYDHPSIARIICVSHRINEIIRAYTAYPEKCVTVHSGVDISKPVVKPSENILRKEFGLPEDAILVGNTSALEGHKDYFTFLDTVAALAGKGLPVRAFIIGKGSLEAALREYSRKRGLQELVIFTGFRNNIGQLLPCLDIFLMTSSEEGLGTSILDAFQAEVPVVATRAGGIPEMVVHGKTGLLAPIKDPVALAGCIESLASDASLRTTLTKGARLMVKEFSKEKMAQKTHQVYREVLRHAKG